MKKLTVIIPTRNRVKLVIKTIDSIFNQNYANLEIIVSDNASDDNTAEVINQSYGENKNLILLRHESILNLSEHWDFVIRNYATGDLILIIPDDDRLTDCNYLTQASNIFVNERIGLVFGNYSIVNENDEIMVEIEARFPSVIDGKFLLKNYNKKLFGVIGIGVSHLTCIFRKDAYIKTGGFNLDCMSPDTYLWLKILALYDAGFIRKDVAKYLVHSNNISKTTNLNLIYSDTKIIANVRRFYKSINLKDELIKLNLYRMSWVFYKRFLIGILKKYGIKK